MSNKEFTIGFVVNPIAGMGGSVGLKGTDGKEILDQALKLGAIPKASNRGREFLEKLRPIRERVLFLTPPGLMGEKCFDDLEFHHEIEIIGTSLEATSVFTTGTDTVNFTAEVKSKVNILVFVGGDGTARDVLKGMHKDDKQPCPVIGIPAGVKIHSSVFGITPNDAALAVLKFLAGEIPVEDGEVMDIDENKFREDRVDAKLFGYLPVPQEPVYLQGSKHGSPLTITDEENKDRIAEHVIDHMEPDTCYLVGPGSTTKPILEKLGLKKTLLGVDAVFSMKIIESDLNEASILRLVGEMKKRGIKIKLVMTVIGAQGFLFGRGNLQFTPDVIREIGLENIIIVMTRYKVSTLPGGKMRNDTRDQALDEEMRGFYRVLVDNGEFKIIKLE